MLGAPSLEPLGAQVVVTLRDGGVSEGPYATLNLGDHVGDDPGAVAENRARLAAAFGVARDQLAIARQVHGTDRAVVVRGDDPGEADVLATTQRDVILCVLVADCLPIALVDPGAGVLAVAHAGWRGTAAGVAAVAVELAVSLGARPDAVTALLGPCISAAAYQVGDDVADAFAAAGCSSCVAPDGTGRHLADLRAANARQLVAAGVHESRVLTTTRSTDGGATLFSDRARRPCGRFALAARLRTHT